MDDNNLPNVHLMLSLDDLPNFAAAYQRRYAAIMQDVRAGNYGKETDDEIEDLMLAINTLAVIEVQWKQRLLMLTEQRN